MARRGAAILCAVMVFLSLAGFGQAEEIKVVITGQAFGALYPCLCPKEPDGGMARRATAIQTIRDASKNVLLLEAGLSFASGSQDQYTQGAELDRRRTEFYLKAMTYLNYDALLVSSQELAFGDEFLRKTKVPFVSSNTEGLGLPYIIKEMAGLKIGILGVTDSLVESREGLAWRLPGEAISRLAADLRSQGVSYIIVLGAMTPQETRDFLGQVQGVDLYVDGGISFGTAMSRQEKGILVVSTWWQAKKIGVLTLETAEGKLAAKDFSSVALTPTIADHPGVKALVPACFNDGDCQGTGGFFATCQNPGAKEARCTAPQKVPVTVKVIRPTICRVCDTQKTISSTVDELTKMFGDLQVVYVDEADPWAVDFLAKNWKTPYLPVFLFDKEVTKTDVFAKLGPIFEEKAGFYALRQESAGVSYLRDRQRIPGRVDVIWDQRYRQSGALFGLLREFRKKHPDHDVRIHFLWRATGEDGLHIPVGSGLELEELRRIACIDASSHDRIFDYLTCRHEQGEAGWWDECFQKAGLDVKKIKGCSTSPEGQLQMQEHLKLSASLSITTGPTFIVENKEIFFIENVPTLGELEKIIISEEKE